MDWKDYTLTPIEKGWSGDKKYCAVSPDGAKYLLRITPQERSANRADMFRLQQEAAARGVSMCRPIECGACDEGFYTLYTWVDGKDAEEVVPFLSDTESYVLGLNAGRELKKIHSIPAPENQPDWETRFNAKADRKIQMYQACPLKYEGGEAFIDYINQNRPLLRNRPQCYQHGDFHIGNMMIENGQIVIIDFDRYDFGDPWEEFNRIVWCAQSSPWFATGIVNGYFDNDIPPVFWKLLALYIASNTLSSLPWGIPYGEEQIEIFQNQAKDVLSWYDNMHNPVPAWYQNDFCLQWIDGVPYRLKVPFDFSFLHRYGKAFRVFDDQDSGNICFGTEKDGNRYFIKFAGAQTARYDGIAADAVVRLKATLPIYQKLRHPNLISFLHAEEIGNGFAMVFDWSDGVCMGRMYPQSHQCFLQLPIETRRHVFEEILSFFLYVASKNYVAIDFYDGSILYDFSTKQTMICDIDFFRKMPCVNDMGHMWGSSRFQSPEEYQLGAVLDEVTNVYTLGAAAFELLSAGNRTRACWALGEESYAVARKAIRDNRAGRQQSIAQFVSEWNACFEREKQEKNL